MINKDELKRDLGFLEDYINIALGIQTLTHFDKNYLSGDNATQSKVVLEHLQLADRKLKEIKNKILSSEMHFFTIDKKIENRIEEE